MDATMSGCNGETLFSKYSYLFVDCNISEICKQMNAYDAQMKLILSKFYESNSWLLIFFHTDEELSCRIAVFRATPSKNIFLDFSSKNSRKTFKRRKIFT